MTRMELALALFAVVLASAALGWGLHLLWERLTAGPKSDPEALAKLSARLAEAEEARDAVFSRAQETEAELREALDETRSRLSRELAERQAELDATMDIVGELRRQLDVARGAG